MEFIFAVARNDLDKVRQLLQTNVDVNKSFLWNSKDTFTPVIPNEMLNRPELLTDLKIDQEYQCKPLNIAVLGGYANMVRLLLSAGADINHKDSRGRTALVCAIYGLDLDASHINTSNLNLISQTNPYHYDIMKSILLCHPNLFYSTLDSPQYEIKGITPLCLASYLGKVEIIQLLLEDGRVNVDGTDSKNATALMYAARDGNVPIVKVLLGYHASPDITDSHGWSAIQYAERCPEIVQMCEDVLRIKRLELVTSYHCNINYPINYSKLSHLLNSIPNYPSSLSHLQFDTIKDVNHLDPSATSLVHIIQSAFLQAIKIHDHLSLQTLLMQSPQSSHLHGGPILVNYHDPKTGLTALHHAMRTKPLPSVETITMLFQAGADMNAQTYYGRTALHHLARFGPDKTGQIWGIQKNNNTTGTHQSAIQYDNIPEHLALCASLLIRFGALVNIADPTGNTPLHFAAEFGGVLDVMEVLMEAGADLGLRNKKEQTPLDVAKSDEIRTRLIQWEGDRRHIKVHRSILSSSMSGTIQPFDSASEYSPPRSFKGGQVPKPLLMATLQRSGDDPSYSDHSDFDIVLRAFFGYQTSFTDSIETALAFITDSILSSNPNHELESTIARLRHELKEAHEMFDTTNQLIEKVILAFREELEQIEQVHQTDWEISKLQHDKIEKLFDVFERIEGRFCQLEMGQDELISQLERIRRKAVGSRPEGPDDPVGCLPQLLQSLAIVLSVPIDPSLYARDDRSRLLSDLSHVVSRVSQGLEGEAKRLLEDRWSAASQKLSQSPGSPQSPNPSPSKPRPKLDHSLNELELSFDIVQSNLHEIKKDLDEVSDQLERIMDSKKKMYGLCLSLEKEGDEAQLRQVLGFTQALFDRQESLEKEQGQLLKEYGSLEHQLASTRLALQQVRPPALLQGLLDRLDTNPSPLVRVEKDWKEDVNLVNEFDPDDHSSVSSIDTLTSQQSRWLSAQCASPLSTLCFMTRLDTSLYSLKVLSSYAISTARQDLLQVQAALSQATTDLDETQTQMKQLYDDAAEVARQVFALKTELETIVRHRKEEVVKVWEVVDEVSAGVDFRSLETSSCSGEGGHLSPKVEDQDRHQWIIRELEQLKHVHEHLQEAIQDLKTEQGMIGQSLRQLATTLVEPQVVKLVGQEDTSLLSVSDQLAELMERIREGEFGLEPSHGFSKSPEKELTVESKPLDHGKIKNQKENSNNTIYKLSNVTSRLSVSTFGSTRSSAYLRSPSSAVMENSHKHLSRGVSIRTEKKRMSVISATSLSSLSSYQQERMIGRASNLSHALAKVKHKK